MFQAIQEILPNIHLGFLQYDRKAFRYKKNVVPRPEGVCVPILNWFTLGLELYCSYCLGKVVQAREVQELVKSST